jgi:hypothetical protein
MQPRRSTTTALIATALSLFSAQSHALTERDRTTAARTPAHETSANSEKRTLPDYGGREEPTTTGDVLLWGPRIVLAPVYALSEYVIRRPLGWAIGGAERAGLPATLYDLFTFGPNHQAGVFPTAFVDLGFRPSAGLYAFWNDAFLRGHDLRLHASTGGSEWFTVGLTERFHFGPARANVLELSASALRRPDYAFFGIGSDSRQSDRMRYGSDRLEARAELSERFGRAGILRTNLTLRSVDFRPGGFANDPRLSDAIASGTPAPAGYTRGYTLLQNGVTLAYDERSLTPLPRAGVFAGVRVANDAELRATTRFMNYGALAGGFVDLNGRRRIVSLATTVRFSDPLGHGEVPFSELVTLGGYEPMSGLYPGRLLGRSAAAVELAYRWPVWIWLDGVVKSELGNVFDAHLAGFSAGKLRWSGSIGVESGSSPDGAFQLLIGAGSETFESGGKVDSVRLVIGATHGL